MTRKISFSIMAFVSLTILLSVTVIQSQKKQETKLKAADITPVAESKSSADLCKSVTISGTSLSRDKSLTITAIAKSPQIKYFIYVFSNRDHTTPDKRKNPMFIRFVPNKPFVIGQASNDSLSNNLTINYSYFDKPDLAWGMKKPKYIQVNVYFEDEQGARSQTDHNCEVYFDVL